MYVHLLDGAYALPSLSRLHRKNAHNENIALMQSISKSISDNSCRQAASRSQTLYHYRVTLPDLKTFGDIGTEILLCASLYKANVPATS